MSYSLSPWLKPRFFITGTNRPLAGGLMYTYKAGTTDPAKTYSDDSGTENTNPIQLDSDGQCDLFLDDAVSYRIILKNSAGVTQFDKDRIASLGSTQVQSFNSIAALRLRSGTTIANAAKTLGYYSAGDGGGNSFYWDGTSTATDNAGTVIKPTAVSGAGRWLAVDTSVIKFEQFGAKGDGSTNDYTAMQAALSAASSGSTIVLTPFETYKCNTGLSVPASVFLTGYNSTINFSASHLTGLTFADGGGIKGVKLVGAGNSSYNASGNAISCQGASSAAYVDAPTILECEFEGWGAYGVYLKYCNNAVIKHNRFIGIGYAAIAGLSCSYSCADYNYIDDVSPGTSLNAYGIAWSRAQNSLAVDPRSTNCSANNNTIKNIPLWEGIDTHGGDTIQVNNNIISNCKVGIAMVPATASGVVNVAPKNCVISGNVIAGNSTDAAIKVVGASAGGSVTEYATGCVISNNSVTGGGMATNSISGAILVYITKNIAISSNTIAQPVISGIQLYNYNIGFNVTGNTIIDPHDDSITVPSCITAASSYNTGFIGGNTFVFENAALGTYVSTCSIRFPSGPANNDVVIGKNALIGNDATHLNWNGASVAGINYTQMQSEQGTATLTITSGNSSGFVDVTYAKLFPITPKVALTLTGSITGGGKAPIPYTSNKTATGVRIIIMPSDLTTFSASGSVTIDWFANA